MPSTPAYRDPSRSVEDRAEDLLGRMTLDEKLAQLGCVWSSLLLAPPAGLEERAAREQLAHGIGQVTRIGGSTLLGPRDRARFANAIQRFLREQTRLGIPAVIHEESCAGFTARGATCFPQALGLAATWSPELIERMGAVIRRQMRASGAQQTLAPVLDVARDPRWGRTEETFGEDPWLVAQLGMACVRGVQGEGLASGVAATGKHFVGYSASEGGLNWAPAHLGPRTLREVYAFPFEAAIREAQLASVMNGYHELDGVPCGASRALLTTLLREELGFAGVVVADYFTVETLASYHRIAADKAEAAARALEAGIDIELPQTDCYGAPLRTALERGRLSMAQLDQAVRRVLCLKLRLGLFEHPYVAEDEAASAGIDTPADRGLARQLAQRSLVLLQHDGTTLPLPRTVRRLAVLGPSADDVRLLQGDYHYPAHLEVVFGPTGAHVPAPAAADAPASSLDECFPAMVSPLEGLRRVCGVTTELRVVRGCDLLGDDRSGIAEATAAARWAEVALVFLGGRSGLVPGCTSGEARDRCSLALPGIQAELLEAVLSTPTPVVIVLIDGRPLALPACAERAAAILHAWLPGQEGGTAIADVLFGDADPGGRLPISIPHTVGQIPTFHGHKPSGARSHWHGDYVDGPVTPRFPFGHGLSYTHFAYSALTIAPARPGPRDRVSIGCTVQNVGTRRGEEVVQLYLRDEVASVTRPVRELRGFARVALEPAARAHVRFEIAVPQLAFLDEAMRWIVEPGAVSVLVGASSTDIRLRGSFDIAGGPLEVRDARVFSTAVRVEPA